MLLTDFGNNVIGFLKRISDPWSYSFVRHPAVLLPSSASNMVFVAAENRNNKGQISSVVDDEELADQLRLEIKCSR